MLKTEVFTAREVQKKPAGRYGLFLPGQQRLGVRRLHDRHKDNFLATLWRDRGVLWGNPRAAEDFSESGNYALPHPTVPGMELISLNDVYWSNRYSEDSCHPESDHQGRSVMKWLEGQLKNAKKKNMKVQLIMHIPPGADVFSTYAKSHMGMSFAQAVQLFWAPKYQREFLELVKDYPGVLVSGFAGHTHMDDFRVLDEGTGTAPFFIHICPTISPDPGQQPRVPGGPLRPGNRGHQRYGNL